METKKKLNTWVYKMPGSTLCSGRENEEREGGMLFEYRRWGPVLSRVVREGPPIRWHLKRVGRSEPHCLVRLL